MENNNPRFNFLILGAVVIVGALAIHQRFSAQKVAESLARSGGIAEKPESDAPPSAPVNPVGTPPQGAGQSVSVEATPLPQPTSLPGGQKIITANDIDPKQLKELLAKMAKASGGKMPVPAGMADEIMKTAGRMQKALDTESDARAAIPDLENCTDKKWSTPGQAGSGLATQERMMPGLEQSRAKCLETARQIGEKYPALKAEIDAKFFSR